MIPPLRAATGGSTLTATGTARAEGGTVSVKRNLAAGATAGLIFIGAMILSDDADAHPVDVVEPVAADCAIVPPRGLPQPCDYDSGWNTDGLRDSAIIGVGCALGAVNGGGPWGCAVGAVSGYAGILFGNLDD
jgi:hypothetical protein